VTIAAGFVANDGIVLCADTQQTISGYIKTYDGKVHLYVSRGYEVTMAVAGAGTSDYIDTARSAITRDFTDHKTLPEIENYLRQELLKFFDEHLARWAYFPERERPTVELLIGVTGKKIPPTLFHFAGTAFAPTSHKAIGDGVLLANELINQSCFGNYTVNELGSLAIYILSKVKRGVEGCGGTTHVVGLRKGGDFALTDHKEIKKLESEFLTGEDESNKTFVKALTAKRLSLSWQSEYKKNKSGS
jgi:20S proteasome alpha/beta subunit